MTFSFTDAFSAWPDRLRIWLPCAADAASDFDIETRPAQLRNGIASVGSRHQSMNRVASQWLRIVGPLESKS